MGERFYSTMGVQDIKVHTEKITLSQTRSTLTMGVSNIAVDTVLTELGSMSCRKLYNRYGVHNIKRSFMKNNEKRSLKNLHDKL